MTDTITTELRAAMNVDREYTMGGDVVARMYCMGRDEFADLCDAIDAVHANLEAELTEWGERGVLLPLDADGVPVRLDDLMEWPDHTGDPFEVIAIGNGTLYYVDDDGIQWTRAETKRHYQPDTWERIIEDAIIYAVSDTKGDRARFDALVARCRALAGDGA